MKKLVSREDALKLISSSAIYGNLGLFIGAGMSMAVLNDGLIEVALTWKQLIHKCAAEFDIDLNKDLSIEGFSYPEVASLLVKLIARKQSIDYAHAKKKLKEKIGILTSWYPEKKQREEYGKILRQIQPDWIITTNYDLIIECLLTGSCISLEPNDQLVSPRNLIPVYHLHGIRTNPSSIVILQEDYISLFRPNQYRQSKLPLLIKESTTLIIGYALGDVNVLTAVDWARYVYDNQRINYPHEIVQLLYTKNPKTEPYYDENNILIVEFKDLRSVLSEIAAIITEQKKLDDDNQKILSKINEVFLNSDEHIKSLIDDSAFRKAFVQDLANSDITLGSGFLEMFSKAIDETWRRAESKGAFFAYNQNLTLLLDILENIELWKIPPALLESIAYNLDRVAYYVGNKKGKSSAAYTTWNKRKDKIPENTKNELQNIGKARNYYRLHNLFGGDL